jgi:hypothetical protein
MTGASGPAADRLLTMGMGAIYATLAGDPSTVEAIQAEIQRLGVPADTVAVWFATAGALALMEGLGRDLATWHTSLQVREAVRIEAERHFASAV